MRTCTNSFRRSLNKDLVHAEQFVDRCLFSEDFFRSTCLSYSTQVRFTAAGLGRCMEASEAEVKH